MPSNATAGPGHSEIRPGNEASASQLDSDPKEVAQVEEQEICTSTSVDDPCSWPARFTETLAPLLSATALQQLREMFFQGPEPPFVSDSGWSGRPSQANMPEEVATVVSPAPWTREEESAPLETGSLRGKKSKDKSGRGRGRGGRGSRGGRGGRGGHTSDRKDSRRVISDVRIQLIRDSLSCTLRLTTCQISPSILSKNGQRFTRPYEIFSRES